MSVHQQLDLPPTPDEDAQALAGLDTLPRSKVAFILKSVATGWLTLKLAAYLYLLSAAIQEDDSTYFTSLVAAVSLDALTTPALWALLLATIAEHREKIMNIIRS